MGAKTTALLGAAVLIAGVLAPRGAPTARAQDKAPPAFIVEVNVTGPVGAADDVGFTIDDVRFVWPTSAATSPWSPATYADFERPTVSIGDFVHVYGDLRADGAVLAASVDPQSQIGDARRSRYGAGLVEAIGADSITVAGTTYGIAIAPSPGFNTRFQFAGGGCGARPPGGDVKVGDSVLFSTDADRVLGWVTVRSNSYGDAASITGRVTRDFATYVANDGADGRSYFGVAGGAFDVEDVFCLALADQGGPFDLVTGPLAEGDMVKVDGRARDGVFLVEAVEVLAWADAAKTQRRGSVRRVHIRGAVTNSDPRDFAVDGIRIDLPAKIWRSLRRRPLQVGDRVDVRGRGAAGGRVAAARLRRN
jgi:hypothetical protein